MNKTINTITLTLISSIMLNAQDLITMRNGEDIKAKVIEVSLTEVKFKKQDNIDGPLFTVAKSDILIIRYANGSKEIFEEPKILVSKIDELKDMNWAKQAEIDAQKYYRGYRKHYVGTFIPCIFLGPIIGLAPAGGNYGAKIKEKDMINNNNPEWFKNQQYNYSYTNYAKKMKAKRVWGGYLGGSLIFVGLSGLILAYSGIL